MHRLEHFLHLIQVALADENIDNSEHEMLMKFGKRMGFSKIEIENHIESVKIASYKPKIEIEKRFEEMYEIMKMVLADGIISNSEMRLVTNLAIKLGFAENEISVLLTTLIQGIKKNVAQNELLISFVKNKV
jgi:uncharacterized tellurite resistance protein B-like protein